MTTYETPGPTALRLRLTAGEIDVTTDDVTETTVQVDVLRGDPSAVDDVIQESRPTGEGGTEIRVEAPARTKLFGREPVYRFRVVAPHGSSVEANTVSGGIEARGGFSRAELHTTSGSIRAEGVDGDASVRTASGSIALGDIGGDADVRTISGSVRIGAVGGTLRVNAVSGSVEVREARGTVSIESVSGRIEVDRLGAGDARFRSVSGSVRVGVEPGLRVWMDLVSTSGKTSSELKPDDDASPATGGDGTDASLQLRASTVSGSIRVTRAPRATAA